jgi:4-amino-4-deoxy-L-arabinose transferase-like glycosyltransferase
LRQHRAFLVLLLVFMVGVVAQGWAMPTMEGSDESVHTTYVELLRQENRLPDRATFRTNSTRQESGQPPLTYWLAAQVANLVGAPSTDPDTIYNHLQTIRNTWLTPPDAWNRRDNLNHYQHGRNESAFGLPDVVATNRVLRLTSLLYGVLAVIGAYGAAREVFARRSWALTATAVFAFMPTLMHVASYFNNDISAIAFATLALWAALRLLRVGISKRRLLVVGLLLALGALSKVSVLLVAPAVGVAIILAWRRERASFWRLVGYALLVGVPLLALFGPWITWGWLTYNDPFGFMTHLHPTLSYSRLLTADAILALMPEIYLSYWAKFGLAKVYLHPVTYTLFGVVLGLSVLGYVVKALTPNPSPSGRGELEAVKATSSTQSPFFSCLLAKRSGEGPRVRAEQALVLGVAFVVVLVGLVRWMAEIAIITGRLMYPAHLAVAIGLTGGLALLAGRFPRLTRPLQGFTVGLLAVAGVVLTPVTLLQSFALPTLLMADELPALSGGPVDYDGTIRLLGMKQESLILSGETHTLTLCWEVLQPATRPAAFSVKLVRDGVIVADRTSFHGMGHYPSNQWQTGDRFCDSVELPYDDPDVVDDPQPEPGTVYDVLVVLLDARTREVDWQPTLADGREIQFPLVGQVVSPAGTMVGADGLTSTDIVFPGFAALEGYRLDGAAVPGGVLTVDVLWRVTDETPEGWTQFIHLVGDGVSLPLADGTPRGGSYPTWAWTAGEQVADRWTVALPDDLPPGEYTLNLGFYRQDTGERMPATQGGNPALDNAPLLTSVTVE